MTNRYTVINPDTLEAMRRAGHVAKLEARIEEIEALEAALREIVDCVTLPAQNDFEMREIARKALEGKDE